MSFIIALIVIITFFCDMFLTYNYVKTYKEMYPKNDWTLAEANPILRFCFKNYDLEKGMVYGGFILFSLLLVLLVIVSEEWRYFLFGLYFMVNIFHLVNWNALKQLRKMKGGQKQDEKN